MKPVVCPFALERSTANQLYSEFGPLCATAALHAGLLGLTAPVLSIPSFQHRYVRLPGIISAPCAFAAMGATNAAADAASTTVVDRTTTLRPSFTMFSLPGTSSALVDAAAPTAVRGCRAGPFRAARFRWPSAQVDTVGAMKTGADRRTSTAHTPDTAPAYRKRLGLSALAPPRLRHCSMGRVGRQPAHDAARRERPVLERFRTSERCYRYECFTDVTGRRLRAAQARSNFADRETVPRRSSQSRCGFPASAWNQGPAYPVKCRQ